MQVSVVMPTYNRAGLIGETLDSIAGQTVPPDEIVIVDDGSTDDTAAVVEAYGDPRVRYRRIPNSGPTVARNRGLDIVSNDWVAFCDSDDLWLPEKLELQMELVDRRPEVRYVFCDFRVFRDGRWEAEGKFSTAPPGYWDPLEHLAGDLWISPEPMYSRLIRFQPVFPSSVLFHRSILDDIGPIDESFTRFRSEDLEFTLRCGHLAPVGVVRRPVVGIRKHEDSRSHGLDPGVVWDDTRILKHSLKHHPMAHQHEDVLQDQIVGRAAEVAGGAVSAGDASLARQALEEVPWSRRGLGLKVKSLLLTLPDPVREGALRMVRAMRGGGGRD